MIRPITVYEVECDHCGARTNRDYGTSQDAEIGALKDGWRKTAKDWLCPDCKHLEPEIGPALTSIP